MTARVLLVGAGEVGAKHLDALAGTRGVQVVGVADPHPAAPVELGVPSFARWQTAVRTLRPEVLVVATPPGTALEIARAAATGGGHVLVEKPATLDPCALAPAPGDERIFVAFQPHFAPGIAGLLRTRPPVRRAEVTLACRRDRPYYRDWRTQYATAGGVLHQQAIHGLALVLRLMNNAADVAACTAALTHARGWAETEDRIDAEVTFTDGAQLTVRARVDSSQTPHHRVVLHLHDGQRLVLRGRNLEAGLARDDGAAPSHQVLRQRMYRALLDAAARPGAAPHPCLFPLPALRRPLEVITHVYAHAHGVPAVA